MNFSNDVIEGFNRGKILVEERSIELRFAMRDDLQSAVIVL